MTPKYRVKKTEWENYTWYAPQRRGLLFWRNYYRDNDSWWNCSTKVSFPTEEKAWEYIRNHKPWPIVSYTYGKEL
jgi:hypothetical protein